MTEAARIFLWVGHPRETSLSHGLADAYQAAAEANGAEVRRMNLSDMAFNASLEHGYQKRQDLEPSLEAWRDAISWCSHTCWFYPYWWGGMPAKMKGALDRALLPGFGFAYHEKGLGWDKLLKGRTGDAIITSDTPPAYDTLVYRKPGRRVVANQVFGFTGIDAKTILQVGMVKTASEKKVKGWLKRAADMGRRAAS